MANSPEAGTHLPVPARPTDAGEQVSVRPSLLDPEISTLSTALDPSELAKQIGSLPASRWPWGVPEEVRVEVLRWHPARSCAFELLIRAGSASRSLIGKVYARDRQDVYQTMEAIWGAGFVREAETSIPQPIAYLPSLRLLLQEKVDGLEAESLFRYGDERLRIVAAQLCAKWLVRFQALDLPSERVSRAEKILARSQRAWRFVAQEGGDLTTKTEWLYKALERAASRLREVPRCPGHGDFAFHNIFFAGYRTVTFDWDLHDVADPARDVARFIVILERQALHRLGSIRALDGAAKAFLDAYRGLGGSPVEAHLPFYKAMLCLRGAESDVKGRDLRWRKRAEAMVDEGLRTLEESVGRKEVTQDVKIAG